MQYKYVDEDSIDETLLCPICGMAFVDPVVHLDCENMFCKNCLNQVKNCPLCRKETTNLGTPPKNIRSQLDRLKVILYLYYFFNIISKGDMSFL